MLSSFLKILAKVIAAYSVKVAEQFANEVLYEVERVSAV